MPKKDELTTVSLDLSQKEQLEEISFLNFFKKDISDGDFAGKHL